MTLRELLTDEHLNSRFVYLTTSMTVCVCVLLLTIMFTITQTQAYYPEMIGILLAGGVGSSAGRWMTGKKLRSALGDTESKEVTTVSKTTKTKKPEKSGGRS